jgi:uncharacterized phage infection (PIP) family protein YhgE
VRRALAVSTVVLALLASGCGGSSDEDATVAWANGLCASLTTWTSTFESTAQSLQDTGSLSEESVTAAVDDLVAATKTLADDVESLGPPELDSADEIEQSLTDLSDALQEGVTTIETTLDESGGGVSGLLESAATLTTTFGQMANAIGQTFSELEDADVKGELEQAFQDAESCDAITG